MLISVIKKNAREDICISREIFKGHDIVQIRTFYRDHDGQMRPSRKGIAFRADLLPTVIDGLFDAENEGSGQ